MSKHRNLNYGDRLPEAVEDAMMEFVSTLVANLKLTLANPTTLQIVAGADNAQVAAAINGRWRYISATVTAGHPAAAAGTWPVFLTASDNVFTPTGNPPGLPPETDATVYAFAMQIRVDGANPGTALYRQIATVDWDGVKITAIHPNWAIPPLGALDDTMANPANLDGVAAKPSWRTLGTGHQQAVAGDDARVPTQGENDALQGTSGAPGGGNRYVTDADGRNTNARVPVAHAASHGPGGSDPVTFSVIDLYANRPSAVGLNGVEFIASDTLGRWRSNNVGWTLSGQGRPRITVADFKDAAKPWKASPYDQMEVEVVSSYGALYAFKYNAGSGSAYKWDDCGSAADMVRNTARDDVAQVAAVANTDFQMSGGGINPVLGWTADLAGDWGVGIFSLAYGNGGSIVLIGLTTSLVAPAIDPTTMGGASLPTGNDVTRPISISRAWPTIQLLGIASGDTYYMAYRVTNNAASTHYLQRMISARPIRVSN